MGNDKIFNTAFSKVCPLLRGTRLLDKPVDELAKGRPTEKILRGDGEWYGN